MSEIMHIEIMKVESDADGNLIGDDNETETFLYLEECDDDDYEIASEYNGQDEIRLEDGDGDGDGDANNTEDSFACDMCDRKFKTIDDRNAHIEDHFQSIDCPGCMRSFIGDRAFEYHLTAGKCKDSVDKDRFSCSVCNIKVFDSIDALNNHLLNEHNCTMSEERLCCELCNRTFAKLKYLKKHIREVHEKSNPFVCGICDKVFNRKANLDEHQLIHDGKYLAKCDTCGKSYRTPSALKLHKRTHTGEKPYVCDICSEKSYAYNTDLKRHKRAAHGILGNPFPCELCQKIFYEPKLLKNHLRKVHKINEEIKST